MTFDPWATDEPVNTEGFSTVEAEPEANVGDITVNNFSGVTVSLKQNVGYDSPTVTFRGNTASEVLELMKGSVNESLLKAVAWAAEEFAKTAPRATSAPTEARQSAPVTQPQQPAGNGGDGRTCAHGTMFYKQGTNRYGKPYTAYFCAAPKETPDHEKCKPIFV